ncbi:MAG TPA: carboxypeptidase-like regulatory domain-containing protein [Burkholderiales bacterium]|nr:carboxypeptidase-like regulatory domain-containing protein [Burkholderiales bacterium]
MLSPRRRQVIIAGLGTAVAPAAFAALPITEAPHKLVLSGRVVGPDGKALSGATVASGQARAFTDADGRFMLVTSTPRYRVTYRARSAEGTVSNSRPDADGMGRASIGLTLV